MNISLKTSKLIFLIYAALYLAAAAAVLLATLPVLLKGLFFLSLFVCAFFQCCYRSPRQIIKCWLQGGQWMVEDRVGRCLRAELLPSSFASRLLIILNFRLQGAGRATKSVLLAADSTDQALHRRLRVLLGK